MLLYGSEHLNCLKDPLSHRLLEFCMAKIAYLSWYFSFGQTCLNATYYFTFLYKKDSESSICKCLSCEEEYKICIIRRRISGNICLSIKSTQIYLFNLHMLKIVLSSWHFRFPMIFETQVILYIFSVFTFLIKDFVWEKEINYKLLICLRPSK